MQTKCAFFTVNADDGSSCRLVSSKENAGVGIYTFELKWDLEKINDGSAFEFNWSVPMLDFLYQWTPACLMSRNTGPNWTVMTRSMISFSAPVDCFYDGNSMNKYTWALSECAKIVYFRSGVREENGYLDCVVRLPVKQFTNLSSTELSIRIDTRDVHMNEAVASVAEWWAKDCKMTPAYVPAAAKEPVYSFWYSYHQNMTDKEIEEECRRAKKLGFDICIVDDGWQTGDNNRGYAFCGDWEPAKEKIPDMAAHVKRVHEIGMKYLLWFSVPYVGVHSSNYKKFENMLIRRDPGAGIGLFDPRYKEVRDFLVNKYKSAVVDWDLDGLKLDFIDQWYDSGANAPYNPGMDIAVLTDAVDALMLEIIRTLREIKPDILLEFRQNYIGPNMRKYGNMFRVSDCPNDYLLNRLGVLDLRMFMGNTAVHSDMLMWNADEKPETAALQIISIMFGVMQYSARLEHMSDATFKMSKFWLDFMKAHKDLLLEGELTSYEAQFMYTWAKSTLGNECVVAAYSVDKCLKPDAKDTIYIANGCMGERVLVDLDGKYDVTVCDCYGEQVSRGVREMNGINSVDVPVGGLVTLKRA